MAVLCHRHVAVGLTHSIALQIQPLLVRLHVTAWRVFTHPTPASISLTLPAFPATVVSTFLIRSVQAPTVPRMLIKYMIIFVFYQFSFIFAWTRIKLYWHTWFVIYFCRVEWRGDSYACLEDWKHIYLNYNKYGERCIIVRHIWLYVSL